MIRASLATVVAASAMSALAGCEAGETFSASRSFTATVAVEASRVQIDSLFPIVVSGERRGDDLLLSFALTLTASSAELAERTLDAWELASRTEAGIQALVLGAAEKGLISGEVSVRAPDDIDLRVLQRNGTVGVADMRGSIEIQSVGPVRVDRSAGNVVVVRVESGDARVDTSLRGGATIDIAVNQGNVQVDLPENLDARVDASATGGVVSMHPSLPSRPAGVPYGQTAGRGVASVVATTQGGTVIFTVRNN